MCGINIVIGHKFKVNDSEPIDYFLRRIEDLWTKSLKSVSLVAEFEVDSAYVNKALKYLGIKYKGLSSEFNYLDRHKFLKDYPAVFLVSTVNLIAEKYNNGGVWPQLADALRITNSQTFQSEWGEAFLYNLHKLNLPTFDGVKNLKQQYVSRMTLHSGIPTRTMNDYFRIIAEQMEKNPNVTAEDFISWAQRKIATGTLYNVDVPVKQFIEYGQEFSVDLADRCIELISRLGNEDVMPDDIALPPRFIKAASQLTRNGHIKRISSHSGSRRVVRPKFILDPHTYTPSLYLPSHDILDGTSGIMWNVAFGDNEIIQVSAPSHWPGEPSLEQIIPLPKPIRQAAVALDNPSYSPKTVNFIDGTNPMVFFDESGEMLPTGVDLPSGNVWVLMTGNSTELIADVELQTLTSVPLAVGWKGWTMSLVDLGDATYIKHAQLITKRSIKSLSSAKISIDNPLVFIKTFRGAPVYASRPTIILPKDSDWEVTLATSTGIELNKIRTANGDNISSLWDSETSGVIGEYAIKIRGALGRGTSRLLYIAEGLEERATHSFRKMCEGLEDASIYLNAPAAFGFRKTIHFNNETTEVPIDITTHRFIASIPYAHLTYDTSRSSIHPVVVFTEDVHEAPGLLHFYTDETPYAYFEVLSNGTAVQREDELDYRNGSYTFNLAKISETLSEYPYAIITFSDKKIKLATVRPSSLFDTARLSPDRTEILFSNCTDTLGLRAAIYSISAPWITPRITQVNNSRCTLPNDLINAGDLLVFLQTVDEWAGDKELPAWPSSEKTALLENTGWYTACSKEESDISAFLSGKNDSLPKFINNIGLLWIVYARTIKLYEERLLARVSCYLVVTAINETLVRQVHDSLTSIDQSPLENRMIPYVLISSGMIWSNVYASHDTTPPEWSIRNSLPATLLSAADHDWSDDELSAATSTLGDTIMDIYKGNDPNHTTGGFGCEGDLLDADDSRIEEIKSSLNLVPKGLLDADSRVKALLSAFSLRHDERIQWMLDNTVNIIDNARSILKKCATKEILDPLERRLHYDTNIGWRGLPAASLSLALLARYASRDNEQAKSFFAIEGHGDYIALRELTHKKYLDNQRNGWAEFAKLAPDMVSIDIILAEIMIAGAEERKRLKSEK